MTIALDRCTNYLGNANVRAFLHVIGAGESFEDLRESAYRIINGGTYFDAPPWKHPYHGIPTTQGGKASGAFQFLGTTWAKVDTKLGLNGDFSPASQRVGAVCLIEGRGAIDMIIAGNVDAAAQKLAQEWVSLPVLGSERIRQVFVKYGGTLAPNVVNNSTEPAQQPEPIREPEPSPVHEPTVEPQSEAPMIPVLLQALLPTVIGMFAPRVQTAIEKATKAEPEVANQFVNDLFSKIMQVTGKPEPVQAVAALQTSPPPVVQEVEDHAIEYLDKMAPLFDKMQQYEVEMAKLANEGRNSAMLRQQGAEAGVVRMVVKNVALQSWAVLGGLIAAVIVAVVLRAIFPDYPESYFTTLVALAGPLFGQVMKERGAIIAYFFDGTAQGSSAAAAVSEQIRATTARK